MERIELTDPRGTRWRVEVPRTHRERARGLRGRAELAPGHAMLFRRCRSVHTFGMSFPIAVAVLDEDLRVLQIRRLPPRRILRPRAHARHVIECPSPTDLRRGDHLRG
jgi:uncharacterized protein